MSKLRAYYSDLLTAKSFQDQMEDYTSSDLNFWLSTYRNDTYILMLINGDDADHALLATKFIDSGIEDIRADVQKPVVTSIINIAVNYYPNLLLSDFESIVDIGDAITVIMRHLEPNAPALSYDNTPMPSGTFTDDFTGTNGDLLENRTGWTLQTDGEFSVRVRDNAISSLAGGGGSGNSSWTNTDQGDADQYISFTDLTLVSGSGALYACVRLVDEENWLGYHQAGTGAAGARFCKMVSGTLTDSIIATQGAVNNKYKIECEGSTIRFYKDTGSGFSQVGTDQTITDFQTETSAGVVATDTTGFDGKFDDWENGVVSSGTTYNQSVAGNMPNATGNISTIIVLTQALSGNMPAASGVLTKGVLTHPVGNMPAPTGAITKLIGKIVAGDMPAANGEITKHTSTSLEGEMPEPSGSLGSSFSTFQTVTGIMGAITGALSAVLNPIPSVVRNVIKVIGSAFKKLI